MQDIVIIQKVNPIVLRELIPVQIQKFIAKWVTPETGIL
jgi:hypothetical protein